MEAALLFCWHICATSQILLIFAWLPHGMAQLEKAQEGLSMLATASGASALTNPEAAPKRAPADPTTAAGHLSHPVAWPA